MIACGGEAEGSEGVAPELPPFPAALVAASAGSGRKRTGEVAAGSDRLGEAGAGQESGAEGAGEEAARWKKFTPLVVDSKKCLGRTWNEGKGGQCTKKPGAGADLCSGHACKVGTDKWLGKVTGEIPAAKLKEFEKRFEKARAGTVVKAGGSDEVRREPRGSAGAGGGVAEVSGAGEQGQGGAGVAASGGGKFKRVRRAGFAVGSVGEDGVPGETRGALGSEVGAGRGAAGAAGRGVAARGRRGGGRVVSGFGAERVEDVRALEERLDDEACDRQRQRREEGERGRMVDFRGQELDRNEGGAFSLRK